MIIDTHAHISTIDPKWSIEQLLVGMDRYHIDYALVSTVDCCEGSSDHKILPRSQQHSQYEANQAMIDVVRQYPGRFGVLLWAKPHLECCDRLFEKLLVDNLDIVKGLKFHPYYSLMPFNSKKIESYIKLAEKYQIPVVCHTATDSDSQVKYVYEMAVKFPKVNFVAVHMGMTTDNQEAAKMIAKQPNMYGDTTWVKPKNAIRMMKLCGSDKLIFGTDSPVDGPDTYGHPEFYKIYMDRFRYMVGVEASEKVLWQNANRLFKLCWR
ncbi:MAG: amidohydrolase family protein [Lachnospiraceae bacterium]